MADLDLIESNVVKNLQAITALKKVYDHEPKNMPVLPAATLFFDGFGQDDSSSRSKRVDWRWVLRIYIRLHDAEQAQSEIKSLISNARKELAKDPTLGGSCDFQSLTRGEVFASLDQNNVHLMAELTLTVQTTEYY
jgi:hypothetical protein